MRTTIPAAATAILLAALAAPAFAGPALAQSPAASAVPSPVASAAAVPVPGAPITWTRTDGLPGKPGGLVTSGLIGADGTLVVVGGLDERGGPTVAWTSADGVTWAPGQANGPKDDRPDVLLPLAAGGYLAVSTRGQTWTSPDGATWKAVKKPLKGIVPFDGAVAADGSLVLAGVTDSFDGPAIATTGDGAKLTAATLPPVKGGSAYLSDIVIHPDGRTLVAAGADGFEATAFWVSTDGAAWTGVLAPDTDPNAFLTGIAATPTGFVAVLNHPTDVGQDGVVYASADGLAWDEVLRTPGTLLREPIALSGGEVIVLQAGAFHRSTDGRTWTTTEEPALDGPFYLRGATTAPDGRILAWGWTSENAASVVWVGTPGS